MEELQAWLLLTKTKGLGIKRISALVNHFGCAVDIFESRSFPVELAIPSTVKSSIHNLDLKNIEADLKWLEKPNNHILTITDDLYPPLLKQTDSPPPLLYVTGNPHCLLQPQLAVVGSRNATAVGLNNTQSFCFDLAKRGIVITSGMALGIDGAAHNAALDAKGQTVAVMGTGLDTVYPAKHKQLAHLIAENGALVSEFPIGTKPNAHNFPRRNRIICGLSLGTLIIEAGMKSGTLITARQTMEINRSVMAIPGSIHNPLAKGCHYLIKQGAKLVESASEILEELAPIAQSLSTQIAQKLKELEKTPVKTGKTPQNATINAEHQKVLENIMYDSTSIDEIISKSELSTQEVSSILLILELDNKIKSLPGAQYIRI